MQFSQPSAARAINRLRILNLLASQENLSRAEAARLLKLNKVSTGEIVEALIAEGLVEETGKMVTVNGRRPTALSLKKDARAVLAVDLGTKATSVALSDLGGNLLRFERFPTPHNPKPEELCVQIIKTCLRILKMMKDPASAIGIAVSVPGSLDPSGSVVASAPVWGWKDVPLAEAISKNTGLDVVLEHNVRAMVLGERWFAASQEPSGADASMLYINWGEHISSAWVADGKVLGRGFSVRAYSASADGGVQLRLHRMSGDGVGRLGDLQHGGADHRQGGHHRQAGVPDARPVPRSCVAAFRCRAGEGRCVGLCERDHRLRQDHPRRRDQLHAGPVLRPVAASL
jgi:hypothetical protein